jgi:hypothetical protein
MKTLLAIPIVAFLAFAGAAGAGTSRSGLRGTVLEQPASPVCKPVPPCTRPAPHVLIRFWRNGQVVAHTRTNSKGRFRIGLRARTYSVTSANGAVITPARVAVATKRYRSVTFRIDTGIR